MANLAGSALDDFIPMPLAEAKDTLENAFNRAVPSCDNCGNYGSGSTGHRFTIPRTACSFRAAWGLLLATLPGSIERSVAGFGDRDAWCLMLGILSVTAHLASLQAHRPHSRLLWTLSRGVILPRWYQLGRLRCFSQCHSHGGTLAVSDIRNRRRIRTIYPVGVNLRANTLPCIPRLSERIRLCNASLCIYARATRWAAHTSRLSTPLTYKNTLCRQTPNPRPQHGPRINTCKCKDSSRYGCPLLSWHAVLSPMPCNACTGA